MAGKQHGVPLPSTRDREGGVGPGKSQGSLWERQMKEGSFLSEVRSGLRREGKKEYIW